MAIASIHAASICMYSHSICQKITLQTISVLVLNLNALLWQRQGRTPYSPQNTTERCWSILSSMQTLKLWMWKSQNSPMWLLLYSGPWWCQTPVIYHGSSAMKVFMQRIKKRAGSHLHCFSHTSRYGNDKQRHSSLWRCKSVAHLWGGIHLWITKRERVINVTSQADTAGQATRHVTSNRTSI